MKLFNTPNYFKNDFISSIKSVRLGKNQKKDFSPSKLDFSSFNLLLSKSFGFCYGVENSIEIAYEAIEKEKGKRIFFVSEMIHNQVVNNDLRKKGVDFIQDSKGNQLIPWEKINENDIVITPAFGITKENEQALEKKGFKNTSYDTTCPFVQKVWKVAEKLAEKRFCTVIHGKNEHEETRATFSKARANGSVIVIKNIDEAKLLLAAREGKLNKTDFFKQFKGRYSEGFKIEELEKIGVVNQTTMISSETEGIINYIKTETIKKHGLENYRNFFADTRNTLCYATFDNQRSVRELIKEKPNIIFVIGGYSSSNTINLAKLCQESVTTFFINHPDQITKKSIKYLDIDSNKTIIKHDFLTDIPAKPTFGIVSGASCPDSLVNETLKKLQRWYPSDVSKEKVLEDFAKKYTI